MGAVADSARWAVVTGLFRGLGAAARVAGDPVGDALSGERFVADPYPFYEQVRARGRVAPGRLVWSTADFRLCQAVLRDSRFVKAEGGSSDAPLIFRLAGQRADPRVAHPLLPPSMLAVNPPEHTRYRTLVSKAFTPRAVERLRPRVQAITDDLLHAAEAAGTVDLVEALAGPLPVAVISEVLGIDAASRGEFRRLGAALAKMIDLDISRREYVQAMRALRELNSFFDLHIARVRRDPGEDILSQLTQSEVDGDRLSDHELKTTAILLLVAGFETTVNLIGNGTTLLLAHPGQGALLRDDDALWPNAIDEMLRHDPPVQYTGRCATQDAEVEGVVIPKGKMVAVLIGGANNDPAVFADPRRFDVTRPNAREQLAFAAGIHYCLGAALARLEGEIALQTLFSRYHLQAAGTPVRRRTRLLRGYDRIPLQMKPAPAPERVA